MFVKSFPYVPLYIGPAGIEIWYFKEELKFLEKAYTLL